AAGELPAVSGPNGKLSVEGGSSADEGEGVATGSFALPLGHAFGAQADAAVGSFDDEILGGGALHLFTRDPSRYLLGLYGSYHTWNSMNVWRAALEGELYIGQVTLEAIAGYESFDAPNFIDGSPVLTLDDDHLFGQADAAYYITDDFKVYAIAISTRRASAPPGRSILSAAWRFPWRSLPAVISAMRTSTASPGDCGSISAT